MNIEAILITEFADGREPEVLAFADGDDAEAMCEAYRLTDGTDEAIASTWHRFGPGDVIDRGTAQLMIATLADASDLRDAGPDDLADR